MKKQKKKTPYFSLSIKKLQENYNLLNSTCKKYLKNFKIAYSIKTNSLPIVIKSLAKSGSGMEVASEEEFKLAGKNKFLVYNSPAKTKETLKIAMKNKSIINIDSKSEIDKLSNILNEKVGRKEKNIKAGLRINLEDSKFGIEPNKILETIIYAKSKNIKIMALHFHQGTQINIKDYEKNLRQFAEVIEKNNLQTKLKYLDIGGGIPDKQQMKNLSSCLEEYIQVIAKNLNKFGLTIILEPGRFLTSDIMTLTTKVIAIKEKSGKKYAILDAGINLLPKITLSQYKFIVPRGKEEYTLAGPLLFSNDVLCKLKSNLKEKDLIRVENVGSYCLNLAWNISYKKPKVIIT